MPLLWQRQQLVLGLMALALLARPGVADAAQGAAAAGCWDDPQRPARRLAYLDNRDYLLAKCGAALPVAQLLQCTARMAVSRAPAPSGGDAGRCALRFAPVAENGTLRALRGFPCASFGYEGVGGADAQSAGARVLLLRCVGGPMLCYAESCGGRILGVQQRALSLSLLLPALIPPPPPCPLFPLTTTI